MEGAAECELEPASREPDRIEPRGRRKSRRHPDHVLKLEHRPLGVLDPVGILGQAQCHEPGAQIVEVTSGRDLLGELAEGRDRDRVANGLPLHDGFPAVGKREPAPLTGGGLEGTQVEPVAGMRLCRQHGGDLLAGSGSPGGGRRDPHEVVDERHRDRMPYYHEPMLELALQAVFAVAVLISITSICLAALRPIRVRLLLLVAGVVAAAAVVGWAIFAFQPERDIAVAATGLLVAAIAQAGAAALARATGRVRAEEATFVRARETIDRMIAEETEQVGADLQRWIGRIRADSLSLLAEEERRLAAERRGELVEREQRVATELADTLATVERRVDERLRAWSDDLDRAQQALGTELEGLGLRQRQLLADAETRIEAEAADLFTTSEAQRASVIRLREELEQSAQAAVAEALDELEAHTGERRRVIEEIAERLRLREKTLAEQIERGESDAVRRIEASFADIERRQIEHLQRIVTREGERYTEAATQQFEQMIKGAREDAAGRLARELDRAVDTFVRQADALFAERIAHAGDAEQKKLEARLRQSQSAFDRQRDELTESFARRIADADGELRRTLGSLVADAESERSVLEARLLELARRIDDARTGLGQI